ncbi:Oxidoreductase domain protein [Verrucomicrobia bacterium]|nr:Oxidoreductase domain protein [Verrucomicrobiota bacterium]
MKTTLARSSKIKEPETLSRRRFIQRTGAAAAFTLAPFSLRAAGANDRLNLAGIGVGGQGRADLDALAPGNNIVALCDVDERRAAETFKQFPGAKRFQDFRRMFDQMGKEIDAVVVATPDHFHAVAAMAAIERGKHVYCEKPLAHSIAEVRRLMKAAQDHKVVTQLGNQGHSFDSIRNFCEWIWDGAIGKVHTVHAGCGFLNSGLDQLPHLSEHPPVPPGLDWEQWLGPALERPYNPAFLPATWRGWVPFGNGTLGDWCCHVVDPVFWALDLGAPSTIEAQVKEYDFKTQGLAFPKGEIITFEFPAKGSRGPVTLVWYSGTEKLPRPPALEADEKDIGVGAAVFGDKGTIVYGSHGAGQVRLIPQAAMDAYKKPAKTIPRAKEHHADWLQAIRNGTKAGSDFSYGGPLTEIALLGVIAIKVAGTKLEWNAQTMGFGNCTEANQYLDPPYRKGWKL